MDAPADPKLARAPLVKESGVKPIRVIPCPGVLEYGFPKAEPLAGHTLDPILEMAGDIAGMRPAINRLGDDGRYAVMGD